MLRTLGVRCHSAQSIGTTKCTNCAYARRTLSFRAMPGHLRLHNSWARSGTLSFLARHGHHRIKNSCVRSEYAVILRKAWATLKPQIVRKLCVRCHSAQGMSTTQFTICAYALRTQSFRAIHWHLQIRKSCVRSAYAVVPSKT